MSEQSNTRTDPFNESLVGKTIRDYIIEGRLGSGGMGDVYRGVHQTIERQVAIKALKPSVAADKISVERFFAEARVVNRIRHENIVECTDQFEEDGRVFMVMELLEGRTLGQLIRETGKLGSMRAVRIAAQIADAIGAAHDKGIIHRDLKPENVFLIRRMGSNDYVKILDFGIARLRPEQHENVITMTETGQVIGTPAYMSPEQAMGQKATPAADIYTLGVILFQALTGRLPFPGPSMPEVMIGHMNEPPPPIRDFVPEVPERLAAVVRWSLEKQPEARPRTMSEFRTSLLDAVGIDAEDQVLSRDPVPMTEAGVRGESKVTDPVKWAGATVDASKHGHKVVIGAPDTDPDSWRDATVGASSEAVTPVTDGTRDLRSRDRAAGARAVAAANPDSAERVEHTALSAGVRRVPVAVLAGGAAVAAIAAVLVAMTVFGGGGDSKADEDVEVTPIVTPLEDDSPTPGPGPGPEVRALRAELADAYAALDEPAPPASCHAMNADVLRQLVKAAKLLSGGQPAEARSQDKEALTLLEGMSDPDTAGSVGDDAEYWYWLAKSRLYAGDEEHVVEAALKAVALCDQFAAAHGVAGTARFRAGKPLDAEAHYRQALVAEPAFTNARYNLGLVQMQTTRVDDALATFTELLKTSPDDVSTLIARSRGLLMRRDPAAAARDLERAVELEPDNALAHFLLGQIYAGLKRNADAKRALCRAGELGHAQAAAMCKRR